MPSSTANSSEIEAKIQDKVMRRARRYNAEFANVSMEEIAAHLNVVGTGTALVRAVTQHIEPFNITPSRYSLLRALYFAPEHMLPQNEIAREMATSQPNVTQLLHALEKEALVERIIYPKNRRVTFARLTSAGEAKCAVLVPDMVQFMQRSVQGLTPAEMIELHRLLTKVRTTAEELLAEA